MSEGFKDVVVLRDGDPEGNRMIVKLTTHRGLDIFAVAVPQDWPSRTGPTWAYLFENEGLTLIDVGATGSYESLVEGIEFAGFKANDIDRFVITHGHSDHDGSAGQVARETGAELWAHDIYEHLLPYNPWDIQRKAWSPLQKEMIRISDADREKNQSETSKGPSDYRLRHEKYVEERKAFPVGHKIQSGDKIGDLEIIHAPGHSPDEIYATLENLVFTGDHVLPEITPHPTMKVRYSDDIKQAIPEEYHDEDKFYGLEVYLRSLKKVLDMGPEVSIMPAHRLFNKSKFNFQSALRSGEIIEHHTSRLGRILNRIGNQPAQLEDLTRGIFSKRKLIGGNLYMAMSEIVAHIELLQDAGDLEIGENLELCGTGKQNYKELALELGV